MPRPTSLAVLIGLFAAGQEFAADFGSREVQLDFPSLPSASLATSDGRFIASLEADRDVKGRVVVLDLTLRRTGSPAASPNLLEPRGHWHGMQPFGFAASDFRQGAAHSVMGQTRVIPVRGTRSRLKVTVRDAAVTCSAPGSCGFQRLTLELAP